MKRARHSEEQILSKLREADMDRMSGLSIPLICQKLGISEQTYFRWRRKYGNQLLQSPNPKDVPSPHESPFRVSAETDEHAD